MRILVADDERDLVAALEELLKHERYTVDAVYTGQGAYDYASTGNYDCIILDIMLPDIDGLEVLRRLRPDLVVERFASEAPPRYHYGRNWGLVRNEQLLAMLEKRLEERNAYQGEIFVPLQSLR